MSQENTAPQGAPRGTPEGADQQDPTAGFVTEEWQDGKQVAAAQQDTPKPAAPPESAPGGGDQQEQAGEQDMDGEPDGDDGKPKSDGQEKPKNKVSFQERIGELTRARRTAERENEELRRRLEALERDRENPGTKAKNDEQAPAEQRRTPADLADAPPDPTDASKYEFGEIDPKYIADLAQYSTRKALADIRAQEAQEREKIATQERQAAARERAEKQVERAVEKYPDFVEKVYGGAIDGAYPLSEEMAAAILESDVGEHIAYHLATNPDESRRVFALPVPQQLRYFGRMEAQFSAEQSAAPTNGSEGPGAKETAPARIPAAPAPVSAPRGGGGPTSIPADTEDFASFERMANKRLGYS